MTIPVHKLFQCAFGRVEENDYAVPVVEAARDRRAEAIGIRVKSQKEHDAVAAWLGESERHRAILFHTAA